MQRILALAIVAAAFIVSGPASAGSAEYKYKQNPPDPALDSCQARINAATSVLIGMHGNVERNKAIDLELGNARGAHDRGNLRDCVTHVAKAEAMEQ
jgi:hypothetical protein